MEGVGKIDKSESGPIVLNLLRTEHASADRCQCESIVYRPWNTRMEYPSCSFLGDLSHDSDRL